MLFDWVISAESLGLPYLNAFLDAVGSNFTHGVNFATAGSSILPQTTTLKQSGFSPISLRMFSGLNSMISIVEPKFFVKKVINSHFGSILHAYALQIIKSMAFLL